MKKKKMATDKQKQWIIDRITESPESCARMKKVISDDLDYMLKMKHPDTQDIQGTKICLELISKVEQLFEIDRNLNVKELMEHVKDIETYGCLDNKPKWEAKCKIKIKI